MKLSDIKKFVKRYSKVEITVKLADFNDDWTGATITNPINNKSTLKIDREYWNKKLRKNPIEAKGLILHELGHVHISYYKTISDNELNAQLWAIRTSKKISKKLYGYSKQFFRDWGTPKYKYQKRYVLARKKFVKEKMRY